jgi:hypothetical protein
LFFNYDKVVFMKVQLFVSKDLEESHAEIYTDVLTDNIQKAMVLLEDEDLEGNIDGKNSILAVKKGKDIVILEEEFKAVADKLIMMTDDGSYGIHGNVCVALQKLWDEGKHADTTVMLKSHALASFTVAAKLGYTHTEAGRGHSGYD